MESTVADPPSRSMVALPLMGRMATTVRVACLNGVVSPSVRVTRICRNPDDDSSGVPGSSLPMAMVKGRGVPQR